MVTILNYPHCFHTALPILGHEAQQARVKAANSWIRKALIKKKKTRWDLGFVLFFLLHLFYGLLNLLPKFKKIWARRMTQPYWILSPGKLKKDYFSAEIKEIIGVWGCTSLGIRESLGHTHMCFTLEVNFSLSFYLLSWRLNSMSFGRQSVQSYFHNFTVHGRIH